MDTAQKTVSMWRALFSVYKELYRPALQAPHISFFEEKQHLSRPAGRLAEWAFVSAAFFAILSVSALLCFRKCSPTRNSAATQITEGPSYCRQIKDLFPQKSSSSPDSSSKLPFQFLSSVFGFRIIVKGVMADVRQNRDTFTHSHTSAMVILKCVPEVRELF